MASFAIMGLEIASPIQRTYPIIGLYLFDGPILKQIQAISGPIKILPILIFISKEVRGKGRKKTEEKYKEKVIDKVVIELD